MNTWIENHNKIFERMWEAKNVPEWWTDLLQGKQMLTNNHMHVLEWNKLSMYNNQPINQSINHKEITYVGSPPKPIHTYFKTF